jgi:Predicted hydrolases or acyltransferases (alpha/beta hydrolase superfamily)
LAFPHGDGACGRYQHECAIGFVAKAAALSIVLVHGALIDGSSWRGVYDVLTRDGYRVSVVQEPLTGFDEDVAATERILDQQEGPTILVGHSYGGSIITVAGSDPKVKALVVGLGTSGTQTLIYGFVANYYRTNVRAAGVAWCAGFGRLGGIGGPMLGSSMIGAGFALDSIFYVLAALGLLGVLLTLLVPMARAQIEQRKTVIEPAPTHGPALAPG